MILRDIDGTFFDETKILGAGIYTNNYEGNGTVGIEIYTYKNNYRFKYADDKLVKEDLLDIQEAFERRNKPISVGTVGEEFTRSPFSNIERPKPYVKNDENPFEEPSTIL